MWNSRRSARMRMSWVRERRPHIGEFAATTSRSPAGARPSSVGRQILASESEQMFELCFEPPPPGRPDRSSRNRADPRGSGPSWSPICQCRQIDAANLRAFRTRHRDSGRRVSAMEARGFRLCSSVPGPALPRRAARICRTHGSQGSEPVHPPSRYPGSQASRPDSQASQAPACEPASRPHEPVHQR